MNRIKSFLKYFYRGTFNFGLSNTIIKSETKYIKWNTIPGGEMKLKQNLILVKKQQSDLKYALLFSSGLIFIFK